MTEKYLVLICDNETGEWTLQVQSLYKGVAEKELDRLKQKDTGAIMIFTGDYVTV